MIVYDPTGFLGDYGFSIQGQAYASLNTVYSKSGPRIAILDYLGDIEPDRDKFDLIIWYTMENFYVFKSRVRDIKKEIVLSPNSQGADFFLSNWIYSTAQIYKKSYIKPNLNCQYIATLFVGRIADRTRVSRKLNRAWAYYETLERGWQDRVMITVRDQVSAQALMSESSHCADLKTDIEMKINMFGDISPSKLPDFDQYESDSVKQALAENLGTTDIFDRGQGVNASLFDQRNLIPENFYRNSFCDIVLQEFQNPGVFLDEKISKPMLMGRPFVVIGPQYYLRFLRDLGFQTFDPVIDESYDQESDPVKRWRRAFDQIQTLKNSDLQSVNDRLKNRLKHNRKMSYNSEYWINRLKNWLNETIKQHTGTQCAIY